MKIQSTTISERQNGKARLEIEIANESDLAHAKEFVILSMEIDCDESAALRLEWLQSRALTKAVQIVGEAATACERALSRTR